MNRTHPEPRDSDPVQPWFAPGLLLRHEADEDDEEENDEDDEQNGDEDEESDDGYSE
jgi:hypothetical protein